MPKTNAITVTIAVAIFAGCSARNGGHGTSHLNGKPAPDFELTGLDGKRVKLSDFRGKPVLLSFFGYG